MTEQELKNKEKRKNTPLTKEEYLTFFFFPYIKMPYKIYWKIFTKNFNESEDKRFIKHGFETKVIQARSARTLGLIFYAVLLFILMLLVDHFDLV